MPRRYHAVMLLAVFAVACADAPAGSRTADAAGAAGGFDGGPGAGGNAGLAGSGGNPAGSGGAFGTAGAPPLLDAGGSPSKADATPLPDAGDPTTVQATGGVLHGRLEGSTRQFLGIPYAAPPIGELRFAPPIPASPWQGTLDATFYGPRCPQVTGPVINEEAEQLVMSEDCLSLNVVTPLPVPSDAPVIVFLHGGSNVFGSSSEYPARWLSESGVVVVTPNYRLGPLAFLTHPSLDADLGVRSGNMGIRDQQLALRWVHDNIAAFGGDPDNVTLFGQSAGALDACLQLVVDGSDELFDRLILSSAACGGTLTDQADIHVVSDEIVSDLCATASEIPACLRAQPAEVLVNWISNAAENIAALSSDPISTHGMADIVGWWPHVDGELIPESPPDLLRSGRFTHVPIIVGSTTNEAELIFAYGGGIATRLQLLGLMIGMYPNNWLALATRYMPATDAEAQAAYAHLLSLSFRCGARTFARTIAAQNVPVYLYNFDVPPAVHSQDLDYVFGWPGGRMLKNLPGGPYPPIPSVATTVQAYWTNFARTSDPNAGNLPTWPLYDLANEGNIRLADPVAPEAQLAKDDCDFLDSLAAGN